MIAWLVLVAVALAVGGLLAAAMLHDPGYVLISYADMTVEASLWFALAALLALWLGIATVFFLIRRSRLGGARLNGWLTRRRTAGSRASSRQGAMLLAEGRWRDAEQVLLESARQGSALADYLGAARAAHEGGRFVERDTILDQAKEAEPEAAFAVELIRTELQQRGKQWRRSVATLEHLRLQAPRHPLVLARLFEAHKALADWKAAAALASALPAESNADLDSIQVAIWRERLASSRDSEDAQAHVRNAWKAMPKRLHDDEALLLDYADLAAPTDAEAALRQGLKRTWQQSWVRRYGTLGGDVSARRKAAEAWLAEHADDPDLLLTLARLALADSDAAQAQSYLERGTQVKRGPEALVELAKLAADRGDLAVANDYYREALAKSVART